MNNIFSSLEKKLLADNRQIYLKISLFVLFIASRYIIINAPIMYSDIIYYQQIGIQSVLAQKQNTSFHEYLFQKMKHKTEKNSNIPEYKKYFEYPPLVVAWFNLPNHFIDFSVLTSPNDYINQYTYYFRILMLFIDFLIFILVFNIGNKFLQVRDIHILFSGVIYIVSSQILFNLLYDRLDLVLVAMILLCFYYQIRGHVFLSSFFISMGIFFKLVPLFLIPVWFIGWIPETVFNKTKLSWDKNQWTLPVKASISVIASCTILLVLSLFVYGPKAFSFLKYHLDRGVQIESFYSTVIIVLGWFGLPYEIVSSYGSQNVNSPMTHLFSTLSPFFIFIGIGYVIYWMIKNSQSTMSGKSNHISPTITRSIIMAKGYLFSLLIILITSKVLSTQYFIWPIPFVAVLFPFYMPKQLIPWVCILALTTLIFPYLYWTHIVGIVQRTPFVAAGPDYFGQFILLSRNFLLGLFIIQLFRINCFINEKRIKQF